MSQSLTSIPFLDLSFQFERVKDAWFKAIEQAGASGRFILGPSVNEFEEQVADYTGASHVVALANGTDALVLALKAMDIGPGDEVITTPFTFFATTEAINHVGAVPIFVDIDERSFNLDAGLIEAAITPNTKAILPVHIFGNPADMEAINQTARAHELKVIEDAAQAFGADWAGVRAGALADASTFSFYPTKVLGCYGDGGLMTTRHEEVALRIRHLRNHGATGPFLHDQVGYNSRLDEIQASLLVRKLADIEVAIASRRAVADAYDRAFAGSHVTTPLRPQNGGHVFNLYTILVDNREAVRQALVNHNIGHSVCYPQPLQLQPVYRSLGYQRDDLPVSEQVCHRAISLPMYPELNQRQVEHVAEVVLAAAR